MLRSSSVNGEDVQPGLLAAPSILFITAKWSPRTNDPSRGYQRCIDRWWRRRGKVGSLQTETNCSFPRREFHAGNVRQEERNLYFHLWTFSPPFTKRFILNNTILPEQIVQSISVRKRESNLNMRILRESWLGKEQSNDVQTLDKTETRTDAINQTTATGQLSSLTSAIPSILPDLLFDPSIHPLRPRITRW